MKRNYAFGPMLILALLTAVLAGCAAPVAPTAAPTSAPAPTAVPPTAAPTAAPAPTVVPPTAVPTKPAPPPTVAPSPTAKKPVSLVYGFNAEPDLGLVPILGGNYASYVVFDLIFNKMVLLDDSLKPTPDLAKSWQVSSDNLVWTFTLADNVKWHDGTPFTANDIKYTYEAVMDPKVNSAYSANLEEVKSIEVVNNTTLKVTLKKTFSPFLTQLADINIMPKHLLDKVTDFKTAPFNRNPVGTGPFIFKEWQTGAFMKFAVNPNYFKGKPAIDEVIYKVVPDADVLSLQLGTGEVDVVEGLSSTVAKRFETNPNLKVMRYTSQRLRYLLLNNLNPLFQDKRARQGIAHALDRQGIINTVLNGLGEKCLTDYPPSSWVYNPKAKSYDYDVNKAKALLGEAGWKPGADGILVKDGKPFKFVILARAGDKQLEQTGTVIRDNLKAVGISVEITALETTALRRDHMTKRNFDAILWGRTVFTDPDYSVNWSTAAIDNAYNFVSYSNKALDALFEKGRATLNPDERKAIYAQVQDILAEEQPIIFLDWPSALNGVNAKFQGYSKENTSPPTFVWNLATWTVK